MNYTVTSRAMPAANGLHRLAAKELCSISEINGLDTLIRAIRKVTNRATALAESGGVPFPHPEICIHALSIKQGRIVVIVTGLVKMTLKKSSA